MVALAAPVALAVKVAMADLEEMEAPAVVALVERSSSLDL